MLPNRSSAPKRQPWDLVPSSQARWSPHKGAHRACDECVQRRHHGATQSAPDRARMTRTLGDEKWFLCTPHGQDRQGNDEDAKTAAKLAAGGGRTR